MRAQEITETTDYFRRREQERKKEQGVAEGLPQTLRKVVPGYAKREIDRKMDAGKFGKTDADKDANFHRYKKIQDKLKEQDVAEGSGNWYVRVRGKVLKDKQFNAIPFPSQEAARTKAMEIHNKKRTPLAMIKITQSWMDWPEQGVAEATGNPGMPHDFTAVQPGVEVWYKGRFAGWTTGKVYDDPYGKHGKMVAFDPNPSEFPGDEGRILSLPYDEVSLRKSTSIGKLKGRGVAEGS